MMLVVLSQHDIHPHLMNVPILRPLQRFCYCMVYENLDLSLYHRPALGTPGFQQILTTPKPYGRGYMSAIGPPIAKYLFIRNMF